MSEEKRFGRLISDHFVELSNFQRTRCLLNFENKKYKQDLDELIKFVQSCIDKRETVLEYNKHLQLLTKFRNGLRIKYDNGEPNMYLARSYLSDILKEEEDLFSEMINILQFIKF